MLHLENNNSDKTVDKHTKLDFDAILEKGNLQIHTHKYLLI